jgi:hypothetical protein
VIRFAAVSTPHPAQGSSSAHVAPFQKARFSVLSSRPAIVSGAPNCVTSWPRPSRASSLNEEYDRILADFSVGDYGEVIPEADENRLTVRNRLKAAAKRKDVELEFARLRGEVIRFKVTDGRAPSVSKPVRREKAHDETPPVVPSLNAAPPRRRGGRPKKSA